MYGPLLTLSNIDYLPDQLSTNVLAFADDVKVISALCKPIRVKHLSAASIELSTLV